MSGNFDTNGMADALGEITNGTTNGAPSGEGLGRAELAKLGWVEPKDYEYKSEAKPDQSDENAVDAAPVWAHNFARYEWKEEYGDVGPVIKELEKELFNNEFVSRRGSEFNNLLTVKVIAEAQEKPNPIRDFKTAGLHPVLSENVEKCGYEVPTPIQAYTIPAVLSGHDVIATAQTGSGKTAAYLVPAISKLMGKVKKIAAPRPFVTEGGTYTRVRAEPLILVIAPTRELCCQIFDEARRLCYRSMLRPCVAYGGAPTREQRDELRKGCDVLIATPGRLVDFMNDTDLLSFSRLRFTVVDEADELLAQDWEDEMMKILAGADAANDESHQYLLFSATFNKDMRKLAKKFLASDHVRIRIGRTGAVLNKVRQEIVYVARNLKQKALYDLLISRAPARTMVFVKSKKTADFVDDFLFNAGLPSTSFHSDRTQRERESAIRGFRVGTTPILVTTGVAGRGIDVRNVMHVINFDLPSVDYGGEVEYVHRIGRTARIGNEGLATSFYNDDDEGMAAFLAKTLTECGQTVPDFLEQFKPEDATAINWNDDSGAEDEGDTNGDDGAGWGAGGDNATPAWGASDGGAAVTARVWGAENNTASTTAPKAWGTDNVSNNASAKAW